MKNGTLTFARSSVAIAVALAFPAGAALADEEVQELVNPNVRDVSVGLLYLNEVNPLYRYYSGLNSAGTSGYLGLDLINRSDNGTWGRIQGRNLGLSGIQEFGASYEKQGDWRIGLDYNEITKYAPYTLNTKVGGIGTNTINLNQDFRSFKGLGPDTSLKLERTATSLSGNKFFSDRFKFSFSVKSEDKSGAIMSAANGNTITGLTPANAGVPAAGKSYATQYFAPQPENYKHNQIALSLDYFTKTFQLTGGYYGSFFNNANNALNVRPGTDPAVTQNYATSAIPLSTQVPWISLPPDNHSQQLYLSGAYSFTDLTRLSFKASRARGVQDDSFIPNSAGGTNPLGVTYLPGMTSTNLGGVVDTTSYAGRLTSRLDKNLDLMASWRYEDRDDKTPIRTYIISAGTPFTNEHESHTPNPGKLELGYRLPSGYRLTGGFDYDQKKTPDAIREEVHENTLRVELLKSMSDTLNGRVMLAHGKRSGGDWNLLAPALTGTTFPTATNVTAPLQFSDRTRDKAKIMLDWTPVQKLSLQAYYEHGEDKYTSAPEGPAAPGFFLTAMGLLSGKSDLYGLDLAYALNEQWKANAYYTFNRTRTHQNEAQTPRGGVQTCAGTTATNTCVPWTADLDLRGEVLGAGLQGSAGRWDLGAKYLYSKDWTSYAIGFTDPGTLSPVPAGAGSLPDTVYKLNRLQLSGTYPFRKTTRVRIDYIYDVRKLDDYTWANWTFSDGTRVFVQPKQTTQLLGVTLIQSF